MLELSKLDSVEDGLSVMSFKFYTKHSFKTDTQPLIKYIPQSQWMWPGL